MPDQKLSDLTATTPAADDLLLVTDVSDTTDGPAGSSRKATLAAVLDPVLSGSNTFTGNQVIAPASGGIPLSVRAYTGGLTSGTLQDWRDQNGVIVGLMGRDGGFTAVSLFGNGVGVTGIPTANVDGLDVALADGLAYTDAAFAGHLAAGDPHPQYTTAAELSSALGSYLTTSAAALAYQPLDGDLTAIAALSTAGYGRSLLTQSDASSARTSLGLGTLATQSGTFSGTSSGTNTGDQYGSTTDNRLIGRSAGSAGAAGEIALDGSMRWRSNKPAAGGTLTTLTDGATVTIDVNTSNRNIVTVAGNRTVAASNDADGDQFSLVVKQDATGGRTLAWFNTVTWMDSATGTPVSGANKYTVFSFFRLSSGVYLGWQSNQP